MIELSQKQRDRVVEIWQAVEAGTLPAPEFNRHGAAVFFSFYGRGIFPSLLIVRVGPKGGIETSYYPVGGKHVASSGWTARLRYREALAWGII